MVRPASSADTTGPSGDRDPDVRDEAAVRVAAEKRALRTRLRHERRARVVTATRTAASGTADLAAAEAGTALRDVVLAVPAVRRAGRVAAFVSLPGEPDTAPLLAALAARGTPALLPVLRDDDSLAWAVDDGARHPGNRLGIPEPGGPRKGPEALADADVVLVPALAVDTLGRRLGQGLGCYDRALPHAPGALVAAVVHDEEVLDAAVEPVPADPWDRPVAAVVTRTRWRAVGTVAAGAPADGTAAPRPRR